MFPSDSQKGSQMPTFASAFITGHSMTVTGSQGRHSDGSGSAFPVRTVLSGEESAPVGEPCLINMDSWRF